MRIACTLLASFFVLACGSGSLVPVDSKNPDNGNGNGTPDPVDDPQHTIEVVSEQPLGLAPHATRELAVRLREDGQAMVDEEIRFEIDAEHDIAGARLGATRARTDAGGIARVDVLAGGAAALFDVSIESDHTDPILAAIEIMAPEVAPAALRVQVSYRDQNRQPVQTVVVSVHDGDEQSCQDLLSDELPTAIERNTMGLTDSMLFDGFDHEQTVTVLAIGLNHVAAVADGCVDGVVLTGGEETDVSVPLDRRDLDPSGNYDFFTTLDTRGAVPGQAGAVIELVADMFEHPDDPARYLVSVLEERSGYSFGFMRETAIEYLDNLIRGIVPQRFLDMFEYVGDAARVVTRMSFEGTLRVYEDAEGYLLADERWETVVFRWRGGCNPAVDPGCDEHRIALRNTHIGEMTTTYEVTVDDQILRIGSHDRTIQYARFFHLFILEIVYPYIVPGASNTAELLQGAVDCTALAITLDDSDGTPDGYFDIGIARICIDDLEAYCLAGLGAAGAIVDAALDGLATGYASRLTLEGAGRMNDDARDLSPESITGGVWNGSIGVDGAEHDARGTFEAYRR